jgi:hypothetical protein
MRLQDRLAMAREKTKELAEELAVIEDSLRERDPTALDRYKKHYQEKGGEQFRPNQSRVKCRSTCDSNFHKLTDHRPHSRGNVPHVA